MGVNRILVINPRSSFTKVAVFDNQNLVYLNKIFHDKSVFKDYEKVVDQCPFRKGLILNELKNADISLDTINIVVGRGGLLKPLKSGVYEVTDKIIDDLKNSPLGEDSVNLGGLIARSIAKSLNIKAYISDPVVIDELQDIARISGHPLFERKSIFHALNQKAIAKQYAKNNSKEYEDLNLIVAHIGLGITIGAHHKGKVIDVNQGYNGEGPFSPKRSGTLPIGDVIELCFSGDYSKEEMLKMIAGKGGLNAYFGTSDASEIEDRALNKNDKKALLVYKAMAYQISKSIGAMAAVLKFDIDAILITGGVANSKWFIEQIRDRIEKIADVNIFPGGDEMEALAFNVLDVLEGREEICEY